MTVQIFSILNKRFSIVNFTTTIRNYNKQTKIKILQDFEAKNKKNCVIPRHNIDDDDYN